MGDNNMFDQNDNSFADSANDRSSMTNNPQDFHFSQYQSQQGAEHANSYNTPGYQMQNSNMQNNNESKGLAIAALVLGISSIVVGCCMSYMGIPLAITGIVLGIVSLVKKKPGKGMAIAGIVTGSVAIVLIAIMLITAIIYINQEFGGFENFYDEIMKEFGNSYRDMLD